MKRIAKITGALLLGALIGALSVFVQFDIALSNALYVIEQFLSVNAYNNFMFVGVVMPVVMVVVSRLGMARYRKSIENESEYEDDLLLSIVIVINSIDILLLLTLFCILSASHEYDSTYNMYYCLFAVMFGCITNLIVLSNIINEIKKYDPLKKGNLEDFNFNTKWIEGLDERERNLTYEAGFKSYKAMTYASVVMILIAGINCSIQNGSLIGILLISFIPVVGVNVYSVNAYKLDKKKG